MISLTKRSTLHSLHRSIVLALLGLAWSVSSTLGGPAQEVALARRYRPGQTMVYQTEMHTTATVSTEPSGLKAFLPPLPTELSTKQQNTVTVRRVRADGSADLENRFDRFQLQSNLPER